MDSREVVRFGNVLCCFEKGSKRVLEPVWIWKLDPYRVENPAKEEVAISVERGSEIAEHSRCKLEEERSGFFSHRIFRDEEGGTIWSLVRTQEEKTYLQYKVDRFWRRICLLKDSTESAGAIAFEYLGKIMPGVLLNYGMLSFHGVLMEHNGEGIILSAPSGTGKTTHARLWRDFEHALIINGDCATVEQDETAWYGFGLPWSGTSGESINRRVRIKALVVLERAQENAAYSVDGLEAFGLVFPHVKCPKWEKELTKKMLDLLEAFLKDVAIVRLQCRPDQEAVCVLKNVLERL